MVKLFFVFVDFFVLLCERYQARLLPLGVDEGPGGGGLILGLSRVWRGGELFCYWLFLRLWDMLAVGKGDAFIAVHLPLGLGNGLGSQSDTQQHSTAVVATPFLSVLHHHSGVVPGKCVPPSHLDQRTDRATTGVCTFFTLRYMFFFHA